MLLPSLRHAFEWEVTTIVELRPLDEHLPNLSKDPGIYALYDSVGNLIYLGQAKNLKQEVTQTLHRKVNFAIRRGPNLSIKAKPKYKDVAKLLSAYSVPAQRMRHNLEALLLCLIPNQTHNNKMGHLK